MDKVSSQLRPNTDAGEHVSLNVDSKVVINYIGIKVSEHIR